MSYQKGQSCVIPKGTFLCHTERDNHMSYQKEQPCVISKGTSQMSYQKGQSCFIPKGTVMCHTKRDSHVSYQKEQSCVILKVFKFVTCVILKQKKCVLLASCMSYLWQDGYNRHHQRELSHYEIITQHTIIYINLFLCTIHTCIKGIVLFGTPHGDTGMATYFYWVILPFILNRNIILQILELIQQEKVTKEMLRRENTSNSSIAFTSFVYIYSIKWIITLLLTLKKFYMKNYYMIIFSPKQSLVCT